MTPRVAVLSVRPDPRGRLTADHRNPVLGKLRWLAELLGVPLLASKEAVLANYRHRFDVLFVGYYPVFYHPAKDAVKELHANARTVIEVRNDYLFTVDAVFRQHPNRAVWGLNPWQCDELVNWNQCLWADTVPLGQRGPARWPVLYYGSLRRHRLARLKEYLASPLVTVSACGERSFDRWRTLGARRLVDRLPSMEALRSARVSLYLQDDYPARVRALARGQPFAEFPTMRFYEALQQGVALAIDAAARPSFEMAGFDVAPFCVVSAEDLTSRYPFMKTWAREQHRLWYRDYNADLRRRVTKLCRRLGVLKD